MTSTTFNFTGGSQTYTVPAGVTFVTLDVWGSRAGFINYGGNNGGYARGVLVVAPGTVLTVEVGGFTNTQTGGYPNGGAGGSGTTAPGSGGGGCTYIRTTEAAWQLLIVAGGGGGRGGSGAGVGDGGFGGGASGGVGGKAGYSTALGLPGTQTSGYAVLFGGPGQRSGALAARGGGGGGGGYYGGIGGWHSNAGAQGGGGGSGYLSGRLEPGATMQNGIRADQGVAVITAVSNPPLAPTLLTPANTGFVIASDANTFGWRYNNVDPGGYQSSADLQYKVSGGAWVQVLACATTGTSYTLPASTLPAGSSIEWQVRAAGAYGALSPWSASSFTGVIAAVAAPTITAPVSLSDQFATPVLVTWTIPAGMTQTAYAVQRWDPTMTTKYWDSGVVQSAAQSVSVPLDAMAGRTDRIFVSYYALAHQSAWARVDIVSQYGPPAPALLVCTQRPGRPVVDIAVTCPPSSLGWADTLIYDLFRGDARIASNVDPSQGTVTDWLPTGGPVRYWVRSFSAAGASVDSY